MIEPARKSIADLLKMQQRFRVPAFQRDFKWGTDEARELMVDLKTQAESQEPQNLFLGNIIVSRLAQSADLQIVDGQQRLTTISLLLLVCRTIAKKLDPQHQHQAHAIQRMLTYVDDTTGYSSGGRVLVSPSIKELFDYIISSGWDGIFPEQVDGKGVKRQVNKIRPIYEFFYNEIDGFDVDKLSRFLAAVYGSYVIYIEIGKQEEAFDIFERTNARGVELDAADLTKNFIFQQQHDSGVNQELEANWADVVENAGGTILRMLKYFWVSRNGYVQKKNLFPNLKAYGKDVGAGELVNQLLNFSEFYQAVRSGELDDIRAIVRDRGFNYINITQEAITSLQDTFQALQLFKVTQAYPLIYSIFESYEKSGGSDDRGLTDRLIWLLKMIENYHFINNVICERIGNEVEHLYADFSKLFFSSKKFNEVTTDFLVEIKKRLAGPAEFKPRFCEISYSSADIPLICYIFDRINNFGLKAGQTIKIFNPDRDFIRRNFDIEHFYPQKPSPGDNLPGIGDNVHNVGNLLVISKFVNRSTLKNLSPKDKALRLSNSLEQIQNMRHVRSFLDRYNPAVHNWDEAAIKKRAHDLAEESYNRVWALI